MTVPTITDDLVAELEDEALMCDSDEYVRVDPVTLKLLLAEREENIASIQCLAELQTTVQRENDALRLDADRLAAVIKDVHWRVDDTTDQLQATGHDGDRRYGLDEWSGPIKNLKMAIEILAKAMQEQPT